MHGGFSSSCPRVVPVLPSTFLAVLAHGLLRVWAGLKFRLLLLIAGVLLLHLHHGAAGPRQVGGVSAQQLPAHPEPGQPPSLQVGGEGRLAARPDGRRRRWRWAVRHRGFQRWERSHAAADVGMQRDRSSGGTGNTGMEDRFLLMCIMGCKER